MPADNDMLLKLVDKDIQAIRNEMVQRLNLLTVEIQSMRHASEERHVEVMDLISGAFPEGDLKSHYRYHMALIEESQTRKAIRLEIIKKLAAGSIWSLVAYCGFKLIEWARTYVNF